MIKEFDCPLCHTKIPLEYMAKKVEMLRIRGIALLACIGCNTKWSEFLQYEEELLASEAVSGQLGIDPKVWMAIRKERKELEKEDEAKVDEEISLFDVDKAKRLFREKWDKQGIRTPLEGMRRNFLLGVQKELQSKVHIKGGING